MIRTASIYTHQHDGGISKASRSDPSDRMYEALKAAIVALRSTARDLDRMGASHECGRALDQANLIQEALK